MTLKVRWSRWLAVALLGACSLGGSIPAAALEVVATLPTLAALAHEVAGPHATVSSLLGPKQDPHYADPRPNLILTLNKADLLLTNGLELEVGWLPGLVRQARNPRIQTGTSGWFDASMWVRRLQVPARVDRAMGDIHPGGNPHFLVDPRAGAAIAEGLGKALATVDPAHAADYQRNANALASRLRDLAAAESKRFAALPEAARRLVVYHDSLIYLVDWLQLKQVATVEPRPGIPPDPGHLAKVVGTMRATTTRLLAQEEFYPRNTSEQVVKLTGGRLVVLAGGVGFNEGQRYEDWVRAIARELYGAASAQ
jgi:zinc/manganese transport system substrate-binding protein